ncbi:hypothetical protein B0H17DRAFT_303729 [Mycena rosella]|uniref:Zn(2)-C6 fungal-type domain-containing protein n=1 Tax=Mycena rosella TaxID=1033263 RepID=A0AAD7CUD7_MYCRO|nr:hypothetical protein B0H17DRAFT_303729 [Mycena rosella]
MRRPARPVKKPAHACASCRKCKTRCEILGASASPVRCHRCKVLKVECSYETTQVPVALDPSETPMSAGSAKDTPWKLWAFLASGKAIDWSAPMLAIQSLVLPRAGSSVSTDPASSDISLSGMLPEYRMDHLLDLFAEKYTPYLAFQPLKNSPNPLVDVVCSAVAARHLEGAAGTAVRLGLQTLAHQCVAQMIFTAGAVASVEAVQGLLVLSLWGPFGAEAPETQRWEPCTLIAEAVRMAMTLRLDRASAEVESIRGGALVGKLSEVTEHARLWIALTNAESMLCLGTGAAPSSRRSPNDYQLVKFPTAFNAQTPLGDVRLGLTCQHFSLFEQGIVIDMESSSEDEWVRNIRGVLGRMDRGERLLTPLPIILDSERPFFRTLHIPHSTARLLLLYHALRASKAQPWNQIIVPAGTRGESPRAIWARNLLQTSEHILLSALALPAPHLSTAPDAFFSMLALAAGVLVGAKFLVRAHGQGLLGASDLILAKLVKHMDAAKCGEGHAAERCALLMRSLVAKWEARDGAAPQVRSAPTPIQLVDSSKQPLAPVVSERERSAGEPSVDLDFFFLNSMLSDDTAFWDSLAQDQLGW